jgi:protein-tyrosine phosphatase
MSLRQILAFCLLAIGIAGAGLAQVHAARGAAIPLLAQADAAGSEGGAGRRVIALQGQSNFRDLGGYATQDGRHVKWRMIFRSGELSHLSAADYDRIAALGVRTVYDLRDQGERAAQPTVWRAGPVLALASAKPDTVSGAMTALSDPAVDATRARAALADFYGQMPRLYAPEYRVIFHELLAGNAPLLLHCTAGKDRSGLASALILTALGVPRATVVQDYELTDQLLKPLLASPPKTEFMRRFQSLPADVQHAMMSADPAYIEAAYAAMEREYGSVDNYLGKELGIGRRQIQRLRALYLE